MKLRWFYASESILQRSSWPLWGNHASSDIWPRVTSLQLALVWSEKFNYTESLKDFSRLFIRFKSAFLKHNRKVTPSTSFSTEKNPLFYAHVCNRLVIHHLYEFNVDNIRVSCSVSSQLAHRSLGNGLRRVLMNVLSIDLLPDFDPKYLLKLPK